MTCTNCNGWGIVYQIRTPPPSSAERRLDERDRFKQGEDTIFQLAEYLCTACGGYGTRPDSKKQDGFVPVPVFKRKAKR